MLTLITILLQLIPILGLLASSWVLSIKLSYPNGICHVFYINNSSYHSNSSNASLYNSSFDGRLKLNHFTVAGSHNSYHRFTIINQYEHPDLESQLNAGLRQLELDIHIMKVNDLVYHLQLFDDKTNCYCLSDCLQRIRRWSKMNRNHSPIYLFLEVKQKFYEDLFTAIAGGLGCHDLHQIKVELLQIFSLDDFITPKEVQGNYSSIRKALRQQKINELSGDYTYRNYGWPPLNRSLGKILPVLLDDAYGRAPYLFEECNLLKKVFFVAQKDINRPYSSIICTSDPFGDQKKLIESAANGLMTRVLLGYGDTDTELLRKYIQARTYDVHIISTDSVLCDNTPLCKRMAVDFPSSEPIVCNSNIRANFCNGSTPD